MIYLEAPSYDSNNPGVRTVRHTLGMHSAPNHKSQTQFDGWVTLIGDFCHLYNTLLKPGETPVHPDEFFAKSTRGQMDHAPDQGLVGSLFQAYCTQCQDRIRGCESILIASCIILLPIISEACDEKMARVGGKDAWAKLSKEEQDEEDQKTYEIIIERLGAHEYDALDYEEKRIINLFIISGCCMHKEHNSLEGGNKEMIKVWPTLGHPGPIKLMNRDNAAAAATPGLSAAKQRALMVSGAGGVKLTSLAGAIFNHKDDKKGQQDSLQVFMVAQLGYTVPFPDTSNICYGSHCAAATELLVHLPLYRKFLEQIRDKKESGAFNHMEQNLYKALHDIPTLTELAALSLYSQSVTTQYAVLVRADSSSNHLDLGPLHNDVKAHCQAIIDNPDLLLGEEASNQTGALYGAPWERPEAFYAIHAMKASLPHLRELLVAMFKADSFPFASRNSNTRVVLNIILR